MPGPLDCTYRTRDGLITHMRSLSPPSSFDCRDDGQKSRFCLNFKARFRLKLAIQDRVSCFQYPGTCRSHSALVDPLDQRDQGPQIGNVISRTCANAFM